ncbi:GFA family protein, partial [Rhizobium leguminosarum]|uniref:GFA family protein n=1 Tax=Rhizobium leguminosarum TaxID=384 RepID=UPI003F9C34D2
GMEWTRGEPSYFQSSVNIERGFCSYCGTPMTYRHPGGLELSIGTFDDRSDLAPLIQVNYEARLPWVEKIFEAPVLKDQDFYSRKEMIASCRE